MTVEFHRPAPQVETKGFLGFGKRTVLGEAPKPEIAKPVENGITGKTAAPTRTIAQPSFVPESTLEVLQVVSPEKAVITPYVQEPGQQPQPMKDKVVELEGEAITEAGLITTTGERITWRETTSEDPQFDLLNPLS